MFRKHHLHHIPIVEGKKLVGMISSTDLAHYIHDYHRNEKEVEQDAKRLQNTHVGDIMITGLGKLEPDDRINVAIEVFKINLFHALPVVENGDLVGILTTHDFFKIMSEES